MNDHPRGRDVDVLPPDAYWIPRLLQEMSLQYTDAASQTKALDEGLGSFTAMMRWLSDPAGLAAAQRAMLGLACTHFWAVQVDWADAWWRFLAGEAPMNVAPRQSMHLGIAPWLPPFFVRPIRDD
jgi:hypothetical protein